MSYDHNNKSSSFFILSFFLFFYSSLLHSWNLEGGQCQNNKVTDLSHATIQKEKSQFLIIENSQ